MTQRAGGSRNTRSKRLKIRGTIAGALALAIGLSLFTVALASPQGDAKPSKAKPKHKKAKQQHKKSGPRATARDLVSSSNHGQPDASAPVPTVTFVPGNPTNDGISDAASSATALQSQVVAASGYRQREFFLSGSAKAYTFSGTPDTDGNWTVDEVPGSSAPYKTRIEVFTPIKPRRFSGDVITEWNNVSFGQDVLPDLFLTHAEDFRQGDAYITATVQFAGLKSAALSDPDRYGSLIHPGDSYSYDIFSQIGTAIRAKSDEILAGLKKPKAIVATGESQSAGRLTTYINAFAKTLNVWDAYLIHSRGGGGAVLQQAPGTAVANVNGVPTPMPNGNVGLSNVAVPPIVKTRTDLPAPVLTYVTESDVYSRPWGLLNYGPATQANSAGFRLWEAAGTVHADDCLSRWCMSDHGDLSGALARFSGMVNPSTTLVGMFTCPTPVNAGQMGYTLSAALYQLARWARTGGVSKGIPAAAPPLFAGQSVGEGPNTAPVRDANGNIVGGVRSPAVDVPVAALTGQIDPSATGFCALSGTTTPFTSAELHAHYPTHAEFVSKWRASVDQLVGQGYILPEDGSLLNQAAEFNGGLW